LDHLPHSTLFDVMMVSIRFGNFSIIWFLPYVLCNFIVDGFIDNQMQLKPTARLYFLISSIFALPLLNYLQKMRLPQKHSQVPLRCLLMKPILRSFFRLLIYRFLPFIISYGNDSQNSSQYYMILFKI
jgi:hypothetical protein